jgi:bisanhydrobacterioruberin hydratase
LQAEHREINTPLSGGIPKFLKILTGILIVMFPVGIFIMSSEFGKQYLWTTTVFLALEAIIMFLVLTRLSGILSSGISFIIIFSASFLVEWWGVNSGIPFGNYYYTEVLQPKLYGVPLAIMFAWFAVSSSCLVWAKYMFKGSHYTAAVISAALILASDILLEPFASFVNNFWMWGSNKIPLQNFIIWFILGFIFSLALSLMPGRKTGSAPAMMKIPVIIIVINILNFSIVNLSHGYYILTAVGLLIFAVIAIPPIILKTKPSQPA